MEARGILSAAARVGGLQAVGTLFADGLASAAVPALLRLCRGGALLRLSPRAVPIPGASLRGHSAIPAERPAQPEPDHAGQRESAGEKMLRELKQQGVKPLMPWDAGLGREEASRLLGDFLGVDPVSPLRPGEVLVMSRDQMEGLLRKVHVDRDDRLQRALFVHADSVTDRFFGNEIAFRGIVEFSNVCDCDCYYCGIRKHQQVHRYTMPRDEVVECAKWAYANGIHTIMLQSGELNNQKRYDYLAHIVSRIREETVAMDVAKRGGVAPPSTDDLGIVVALSAGEMPQDVMQRMWDAGARRYLIRIETSNPDLFAKMHPPESSWHARAAAIHSLREMGFQVGTGVMVGVPGQTLADMAGDVEFFRTVEADMLGMGPYIIDEGTLMAATWHATVASAPGFDKKKHMDEMVLQTMRMNALARINLGNVNIAATTALQAIDPMGREVALSRGANILMPILTPTKYREDYQLYEGKPCITDSAEECRRCLNARVSMVGKRLLPAARLDPPHHKDPISWPGDAAGTRHLRTRARGMRTSAVAVQSAVPAPREGDGDGEGGGGKAVGPVKGSDVPRVNVGVFGSMNAGKSTLMNLITRQETSIVDAKAGTTADTKVALMELHALGPAKLFDTAGIDEDGVLGDKKRRKAFAALKECDMACVVVDPSRLARLADIAQGLAWERTVMEEAARHGVAPVLVFNVRRGAVADDELQSAIRRAHAFLTASLPSPDAVGVNMRAVTPGATPAVTWLAVDLNDPTGTPRAALVEALEKIGTSMRPFVPRSLPDRYLSPDAMVFLNIPMDDETPSMRLLRPQALLQEEAIRHWAQTLAYRMDLAAARSGDPAKVAAERRRFLRALDPLLRHPGPCILVTDSQAMDIVHPWTMNESGQPLVDITTFSIAMMHRQSGGQLSLFADGLRAYQGLRGRDARVLVAEACNHNRITDTCNDIGMVQLPQQINRHCSRATAVDHAFGREFPDMDAGLGKYDLVLHCGACMIDHQKVRARLSDLKEAHVPVTNYGLLLAYAHHGEGALKRVLAPWGVKV